MIRSALLLLGLLVAPVLAAQPTEALFHRAANQFIAADNDAALATVNEALRAAPRDARLLRLKEEIERKREEEHQQEQQNGEQSNDQQGNQQGQQDQQQEGQGSQGQGQDSRDGQQPGEQQDPGEQDSGERRQEEGRPQPGDEPSERQGQGRPQPGSDPTTMSRAQAERILQALGNEEETLLRRVARPQARPRRVEKDW